MAAVAPPSLLEKFSTCCSLFEQITDTVQGSSWAEDYGRLRLWAGDVNIRRKGKSSLDYKLREASNLREVVMELFEDINGTLRQVIELQHRKSLISPSILRPPLAPGLPTVVEKKLLRVQRQSTARSINIIDLHHERAQQNTPPKASDIIGEPAGSKNESGRSLKSDRVPDYDNLESSLGILHQAISDVVEDLYSLSTALRDPSPHDQITDPVHQRLIPFPDAHDVQHVREKFPNVPQWLACRLGKGNAKRRDRNLYCKETAKDFAPSGVNRMSRSQAKSKITSSTLSTKVDSVFDGPAPRHDSDSEASEISATSYAVTISKHGDQQIGVPKPPAEFYEDLPFECPICFCIVAEVRNMKQWKKHVFEDLTPYMCTHENCQQGEVLFTHRRQWFQHELSTHFVYWLCNASGCNLRFDSEDLFIKHLETVHRDTCAKAQLATIARLSKFRISDSDSKALTCPLCLENSKTKTALCEHLGGELEKLALFVLPPGDTVDSDSDSSSNSEHEEKARFNLDLPSANLTDDSPLRFGQQADFPADAQILSSSSVSALSSPPRSSPELIFPPESPFTPSHGFSIGEGQPPGDTSLLGLASPTLPNLKAPTRNTFSDGLDELNANDPLHKLNNFGAKSIHSPGFSTGTGPFLRHYRCNYRGCTRSYTRSDNLKAHQRDKNHFTAVEHEIPGQLEKGFDWPRPAKEDKVPTNEHEPVDDGWGSFTTSKKDKKKNGKNSIEEAIPEPVLDGWGSFTTSKVKKKKGKFIEEVIPEPVKEEPPILSSDATH